MEETLKISSTLSNAYGILMGKTQNRPAKGFVRVAVVLMTGSRNFPFLLREQITQLTQAQAGGTQ